MQEPLNKNEIIEKIARRLQCTRCGRRYKAYDFSIIEERENLAVMRLICRECHRQSVVLAVVQRHKVRPVLCELEPDEWRRFSRLTPLNSDDVLQAHRDMLAYDGDFTDVLEDPLPPEEDKEF